MPRKSIGPLAEKPRGYRVYSCFFQFHFNVLPSVRPQMVDIGSEQGLSNFETGGIARAMSRISKERKRRSGPKDAVCGWALANRVDAVQVKPLCRPKRQELSGLGFLLFFPLVLIGPAGHTSYDLL